MTFSNPIIQVLTATRKQLEKSKKQKGGTGAAATAATAAGGAGGGSASAAPKATVVMEQIAETLPAKGADLVSKMKGVIQWDINGEKWVLDLKNGNGNVAKGEGPADLTVTMSDDVFFDVSQGKVSAQQAFMKVLTRSHPCMHLCVYGCVYVCTHPRLTISSPYTHTHTAGAHQDQGQHGHGHQARARPRRRQAPGPAVGCTTLTHRGRTIIFGRGLGDFVPRVD